MRISEIAPKRISKKILVFEILIHELSADVYNLYVKFRTSSKGFSLPASKIIPYDSIYEYIEILKVMESLIKHKNIRIPQSLKLIKDLLEYFDE